MAIRKAFAAMVSNDWNIVTEILDKDELSTEDINQYRYEVGYLCI